MPNEPRKLKYLHRAHQTDLCIWTEWMLSEVPDDVSNKGDLCNYLCGMYDGDKIDLIEYVNWIDMQTFRKGWYS